MTGEERRARHREAQARYRVTAKGRATQHRYAVSEKNHQNQGRYYERMPFPVYAKKIMGNRRRAALKRQEGRRRGQVQNED